MNQTTRSLVFVGIAVVSVVVAAGTHYAYKPADLREFSDVGSDFFPKFLDPNDASALQVATYNSSTGKTDVFKVEFKDGLWRIPSHHDYPADGESRLAKTAASLIGVRRLALVERSTAAQKRYRLLDPLDSNVSGTEGRGDRVTLYKGDQVLADFIIGEKVEGEQNLYYVRRPDENRIYTADLGNLSLSAKFSDWIEKDVLDVARNDVREIEINRYYVDELQGRVVPQDRTVLTRASSSADWSMKDLDAAKEKVKVSEVNNLLSSLDSLQIVGVRPKPPGMVKVLKSEGSTIDQFTEADLAEKGFFISPRGGLVSNEGEVHVGTDKGVLYILGFGEEFSGSEIEIEVGGEKKAAKPDAGATADAEKKDEAAADAPTAEGEEKSGEQTSRYLLVTVAFDKSLLGEEPKQPVKPEPPAADATPATQPEPSAAEAAQPDETPKPADDEQAPAETATAPGTSPSDDPPADAAPPAAPAESAPQPSPQEQYEAALKQYEEDLELFETRKKQYDEKLKEGQERVTELNRRFADWYYVIPEDLFTRLKLKREELVEPVTPPAAATPPETEAALPDAAPAPPEAATPPAPSDEAPATPDSPAPDAAGPTEPASESPAPADAAPSSSESDAAAPESSSEEQTPAEEPCAM